MLAHAPKWVYTDLYAINAVAEGNPTKDQMRLMLQSLLADRFKLAAHFEHQEARTLALVLDKPGKTGAKLYAHSNGPPCDVPDVFDCNSISAIFKPNNVISFGGGDLTTAQITAALVLPQGCSWSFRWWTKPAWKGGSMSRSNLRESQRTLPLMHITRLFKTSLDWN
jgi:hypothetical protein